MAAVPAALQRFVQKYLRTMNAPALTLGLATRGGSVAAEAYGFVDPAAKTPATPGQLFQIGSITKSFAGLLVLQLQDEGKLDVQQPILRYLPSLPVELDYGDITIHHLLTHTSGMPNQSPTFPADHGARTRQGAKPGTAFHYSNWGYNVLGKLIEALDGCSWSVALTRRLFVPLGMKDSAPTIDSTSRARIARSYQPLHDDRPYPRGGALAPAGKLSFDVASGSIASTPADMNRYMQMLLNRGVGPAGRILSEQSFTLFATGHVEAPDFGPGARYGYGLAIDQLDGHTRLKHTGGMPSFMASMQLDMDAGIGAFASINADQDYRPNAVTQYSLRLLRARQERRAEPAAPSADEWPEIEHPADYTGAYTATDGRQLEVTAQDNRLLLVAGGNTIPLQHRGDDEFIADHPAFARFMLQFGRESRAAQGPDTRPRVMELNHGPDWYAHARFTGERVPVTDLKLAPYSGYYQPDNTSLLGPVHIVERRGRLWANGVTLLEPMGNRRFRVAGAPGNTELVEFRSVVDGHAEILIWTGQVLRRIP